MKRLLLTLLAFTMCVSMCACGKEIGYEQSDSIEVEDSFGQKASLEAEDSSEQSLSLECEASSEQGDEPHEEVGIFSAEIGDSITFGTYEQDNNTLNGKESVEWVVLAKEDNKILVISKYALDNQPYDDEGTGGVTWETCTLRKWLNDSFINNTFSSEEQAMITTTMVRTLDNPKYGTYGGKDTLDKVFLLSIDEVTKYNVSKLSAPTEYEKGENIPTISGDAWWLRSRGWEWDDVAFVDGGGIRLEGIYSKNDFAVRPALWISLSTQEERYSNAVALIETDVVGAYKSLISLGGYKDSIEKANSIYATYMKEKAKTADVRDCIYFGSYEQDNDLSNGKEDVEWLVLAKEENKILVISKYALDCQPYNVEDTDTTWETSSLRKWLNNDFIKNSFSPEEQSIIITTTVTNQCSCVESDTQDKVFLLSVDEADEYFSRSGEDRQCQYTDYAETQGVTPSYSYSDWYGETYYYWCWWLRSSYFDANSQKHYPHYVSADNGQIWEHGCDTEVNFGDNGIRPAMWITFG